MKDFLFVLTVYFLVCSRQKSFHIDGEFNGIACWSRPEVVLSCFEALFPSVEMHGSHLSMIWVWQIKIQRLGLTYVGSPCQSQINQLLLRNLPYRLIECFQFLWNLGYLLYRTIMGNEHVFYIGCPFIDLNQITNQMLVDAYEFTC